jgi:hypothetical protein
MPTRPSRGARRSLNFTWATVPAVRRLLIAAIVLAATGLVATSASALTVQTSSVARIGAGAARLTAFTDGTGKLYVNLKGLTPGAWNEHLWSGTCTSLGTRVAVLPGLAVPATGAIVRSNSLTTAQAKGRTLRIVHGTQVLCTTFGAGIGPSPSSSASPSGSASPSASPSSSPSASPSSSPSASPSSSASPSPSGSDDHGGDE